MTRTQAWILVVAAIVAVMLLVTLVNDGAQRDARDKARDCVELIRAGQECP